jgi:hypothetical protein
MSMMLTLLIHDVNMTLIVINMSNRMWTFVSSVRHDVQTETAVKANLGQHIRVRDMNLTLCRHQNIVQQTGLSDERWMWTWSMLVEQLLTSVNSKS